MKEASGKQHIKAINFCSAEFDPNSEIIACVWPEGVMRLPLLHDAFTILDLLFFGRVRLSKDGIEPHRYTDADNLIGRWGRYFAQGRTCHIEALSKQFPASNPDWVCATFG